MLTTTKDLLSELKEHRPKGIGFDIETYTDRDYDSDIYATPAPLYPWLGGKIRLLQFAFEVKGSLQLRYLDTKSSGFDWVSLQYLFETDEILHDTYIIGHNLAFEYAFLAATGIRPRRKTWDIMLGERILSSNLLPLEPVISKDGKGQGLNLASICKRYLQVDLPKEEQTSNWGALFLSVSQVKYALNDVRYLLDIARSQYKFLKRTKQLDVFTSDCEALPLLAACNATGIRIDTGLLRTKLETAENTLQRITEELKESMGIENPNSPAQLMAYFDDKGVPIENTTKKVMDGLSLEQFPDKLKYLEMKALTKSIGTYYKNWENMSSLTGGYLYPNLKMIGADSGRMSCPRHFSASVPDPSKTRIKSGPNEGKMRTSTLKISSTLQGAPSETRELFMARPGYVLVDADFSAIEVRLAAHIYKDSTFKRIVREGLDQHVLMASEIYGVVADAVEKWQRKIAKTANFALIYACWVKKLRLELEIATGREVTWEEAETVYNTWHKLHQPISKHMSMFREKDVYELRSLAGRRMMKKGKGKMRNDLGFICSQKAKLYSTDGTNWPVQSTGKDLFAGALRLIWDKLYRFGDAVHYLMLVHDEILLEAREDVVSEVSKNVHECMTDRGLQRKYLGDVELAADVQTGHRWSDVH